MIPKQIYHTLKKASKTYFYNTLFFPEDIRKDVFTLYAYVRVADNYVDIIPQQKHEFFHFKQKSMEAMKEKTTGNLIIDEFFKLAKEKHFDMSWITAFLDAMEQDLTKKEYITQDEVNHYMYGSAEVVGLMMARIMDVKEEALEYAGMLGRVLQYINFIRHIEEDYAYLGRNYFPQEDMKKFGLESLEKQYLLKNEEKFREFITFQMDKVRAWQKIAVKGFDYLPKLCLMPIRSANNIYLWTGKKVEEDPFVVFDDELQKQFKTYFYMLFIVNFFQKAMK